MPGGAACGLARRGPRDRRRRLAFPPPPGPAARTTSRRGRAPRGPGPIGLDRWPPPGASPGGPWRISPLGQSPAGPCSGFGSPPRDSRPPMAASPASASDRRLGVAAISPPSSCATIPHPSRPIAIPPIAGSRRSPGTSPPPLSPPHGPRPRPFNATAPADRTPARADRRWRPPLHRARTNPRASPGTSTLGPSRHHPVSLSHYPDSSKSEDVSCGFDEPVSP